MRTSVGTIHLAVFLLCFPGYPLLVGIIDIVGLPGAVSSTASLVMRLLTVVLAGALILGGLGRRRDNSSSYLIMVLAVFWLAYLVRMFYETIYQPQDLWQDPSYYWMWSIGGCLLPMLGLALYSRSIEDADGLFKWFYAATFTAGALALLVASEVRVDGAGNMVETGRARIADDRLNPISLGHLGAMLVLHSLWALVFFRRWRTTLMRLLLLAGLCSGLYILMMANSRGPILVTIVCLAIIVLFAPSRYKFWLLILSGIAVASIVPIALYLEHAANISVFTRLFGATLSEHAEQSMRLQLYSKALEGFLQSPWIGSSLEVASGGHPHNVIIELFMATGVFFGLIFTVFLGWLFIRGYYLITQFSTFSWPALLFFQYLIGAQFSGSFYNSTYLWASIGLLISLRLHDNRRTVNKSQYRNNRNELKSET